MIGPQGKFVYFENGKSFIWYMLKIIIILIEFFNFF